MTSATHSLAAFSGILSGLKRSVPACAAVVASGLGAGVLAAEEAASPPARPDFVHRDQGSVIPARIHDVVSTEITDLVLVPAGYASGYRPGMVFRVTRDESQVAEIMMVEVRDQVSAAVIVGLSPEQIIEPGDLIRVKTVQH